MPYFQKNTITAFPTNTSYGFGVRFDDTPTMQRLYNLKKRPKGKFFSLMVKNFTMLQAYAHVPNDFPQDFFTQKPRTAILKPKNLPICPFWPEKSVAFRICTIPQVQKHIMVPITATSANISGNNPIFKPEDLKKHFKNEDIVILDEVLPQKEAPYSEIWDFTQKIPKKIR